MNYELVMAFEAISQLADAWSPDRPKARNSQPRAGQRTQRLWQALRRSPATRERVTNQLDPCT